MGFGTSPFGASPFGSWSEEPAVPEPDATDVVEAQGNLCGEIQDLLIEQYKAKPRIDSLLCILLDEVQAIDVAGFDLHVHRGLDSAYGAQLDGLGALVGRSRGGLDDPNYRARIRVQILVNKSSGRWPELMQIMAILFPDGDVEFRAYWPASVIVRLHQALDLDPSVVAQILRDAASAGVRILFVYSLVEPASTFRFASLPWTGSREYDDAAGYGADFDETLGGAYAGARE